MDKTIRLFEKDPYLKTCDCKVLSAFSADDIAKEGEKNTYILTLDSTIFFPEGGGQPSDTGYITGDFGTFKVDYVFEDQGLIMHKGSFTEGSIQGLGEKSSKSIEGQAAKCRIDWERRFSHMQRHCGEHILSAVFYDLYGGVNRGFHMSDDYMTIDISLEENPDYSSMNEDMIQAAEWSSNEMVWNNLPVSTRHFKTKEEAAGQPMRKALNIEEDIVLVCVGDEGKPAGCVACCGTHPHYTGEVGLIKIFKWENYKGMTRITFDAGSNALKNHQIESQIIKELCIHFSSEAKMLLENIKKREEKNHEARQDLHLIKRAYLAHVAEEIATNIQAGNDTVFIGKYEVLKIDDLLAISKTLPSLDKKLAALISTKENTLILLSNGTPDCNKIIKDNAAIWNGKGGGRSDSARAMFTKEEDLDCFLDYLKKAF